MVFARIMVSLAAGNADPNEIMTDTTSLKAQRKACSLHANKGGGRLIGRGKGGLNRQLHAVTDAEGRPMRFYLSAGQISDHTGGGADG